MTMKTHRGRPRARTISTVLLAGALTLAACGTDDNTRTNADSTPTSTSTSESTSTSTPTSTSTTESTSTSTVTTPTDSDGDGQNADDGVDDDGSADAANADQIIVVTVAGGSVEGGADRHAVALGSVLAIEVTLDVADEVHVHGYDVFAEAVAGDTATVLFVADIPGVFEVELEHAGLRIADIEVS